MGSASREALAVAQSALTGKLGKTAGSELLSAAAQLDQTPALLGALADSAASADSKTKLVERVFVGASAGARAVLTTAATQSWSSPGELVDGIEELGLRAEALGSKGLADELLTAASVVDSDHELELSLGSKLGDSAAKLALIDKLFTGKLSAGALAVVKHLVANPRSRRLSPALRESARVVADQGGTELATVTVASPLSAAQHKRLSNLLETSAGRPVHVTTVVDPSLVGGVRIQIGDEIIDGSIRTRLDDLRLQLVG